MIITIIKAYDHFTTHSNSKECFLEAIGENIGEDEIYLWLRSMRVYFPKENDEPEDKIQKILKSAIFERKDIPIKDEVEELQEVPA